MRRTLKQFLNIIALVVVSPLIGLSKLGASQGSERLYLGSAQALATVPGVLGVFLRRAFYRYALDYCHWDVVIEFGTYFSHPQVHLDEEVVIGAYSILGRCRIGARSLIGGHSSFLSGRRQHGVDSDRNKGRLETLLLGRDCWIGEGTVIMADVGDGSVVGAGSVVVKPVEPNTVVAGNPAKPIKAASNAEA